MGKRNKKNMDTLKQIWDRLNEQGYGSDKLSVHSYGDIYEAILAPYRHTAINVLEIGLFNGHSLRMWEQYFTMANVHGIDCSETPHGGMADLRPMIQSGQHHIHIGNAESSEYIESIFKGIKFQVILEDAAHNIEQQLQLYKTSKPHLDKDGIYIIEDIQDIDKTYDLFLGIDSEKEITIIDRRYINNRYDDVLITITDKK